jgi:hypothetical protein
MKELLLSAERFDPHAKGFKRREAIENINKNRGQAYKPDSVIRVRKQTSYFPLAMSISS